ncbi:hypothetical protein F8M41_022408 [Gigaspora margarita]|uniref:Peptidase S1 domain-containing protein n=1 Tax=Gigaspora margarita TaxID=4874 RepID=A0A8H4AF28_GIGMA|nr:hypothetical protein F8M41_022408 [Gigaspora margarita]
MYICTAGFWVRTTNLSTYLVSAGHCAINGSVDFYHLPWDSEIPDVYIGSLVSYTTSGVDRGFILKQNDSISVHPIIRNTEDQEHPVLYIIGTTDLDVGSIDTLVCKSGYLGFRHVECAKVLAVNVTVKMGDQRYGGVVKVDHMGCDGNSGAPVYQYLEELLPNVLLVGMLMGGNNIFCVVVPIKLILTEDMHVITINDP